MGKKNKKAGNNAKKVKEQPKAEDIEVSKPSTPESHPHSPDSTVTPPVPTEEAEPEVGSEGLVKSDQSSEIKDDSILNGTKIVDEPTERSGEDINWVVDIEDVVEPTTPPGHLVDIVIEQDISSSTIPANAEEDINLAQSEAEEQRGEELLDEAVELASEEPILPEEREAEADILETNAKASEPLTPSSNMTEVETPAYSKSSEDAAINGDEELVDATEGLNVHDVPSETIPLADNLSETASDASPKGLVDTKAEDIQVESAADILLTSPPHDATSIHVQLSQETAPEESPLSPPRSPGFRDLLPSRANPRSPSPKISREESEAGPSRRPSASSPLSSPGYTSPSRSGFASPIKSPRSRPPSFLHKPTIPASAPIVVTSEDVPEEVIDDSAPFESVPLQTTPPPVLPATLPSSPNLHPGSPTSLKRSSWSGFGVGKPDRPDDTEGLSGHIEPVDTHSRSSISTIPLPRPSSSQLPEPAPSNEIEKPRLHAPPAHPHPFPIPSPNSPRPSHEKRPSHSGPTVPAPAHSTALGAKGVSTFEKVISHTRPSWLPPKDRVEDETHYHQWEEMMSQAREVEKEKRKAEEARRFERDKRLAINTPKWEEMLDEKTFNADKIRKDPVLRGIWFEGAPTYLRGKAWSLAIGNPLALSKDLYKSCVVRSQKAIASGRFPANILERIEKDLDQTLVNLHLFQHGSPLRADLHELICAWVVYRSDTAQGYASYINLLAAMFLLSSPPATAFLSLVNLLSRPVLRAFYSETQDEIDAFYRVFENLQADMFPQIFANCKNLGLKVPESWFRSVLVEQVPFEAACRLWDQIVLDGDGYFFRSALAIFGFLEPRLYFPDRGEIESVLEGRNHATQAIVDRERERAKLRGETYLDELDGKLSVFGLNEQALFDWLAKDGWKEARFERLVTREMPD